MDFILNTDACIQIQELVQNAFGKKIPLKIYGSDTKSFYGNKVEGHPLCLAGFNGIIDYEPSKRVLSVRSGTRLSDIEKTLSDEGQMLAFEPPYFGEQATFGGTIACGLSGPRRPYAGAMQGSVLGIKCINGKGEVLIAGQVTKNAGHDISRLMVGALGTLGVLLDISVRVIPKPEIELTLMCQKNTNEAIQFMNTLATKPNLLSAAVYIDGTVYIRFSGERAAVNAAINKINYDQKNSNDEIWQQVREQTHPFFDTELPLWRLSVAVDSPVLDIPGEWLIDWGGAQRWLKTNASAKHVRDRAANYGGDATLFKRNGFKCKNNVINNEADGVYHPLPSSLAKIHKKLKVEFDPNMILNRNKFYKDSQ